MNKEMIEQQKAQKRAIKMTGGLRRQSLAQRHAGKMYKIAHNTENRGKTQGRATGLVKGRAYLCSTQKHWRLLLVGVAPKGSRPVRRGLGYWEPLGR